MTSEVCVMNRLAAVLAADTALTITSYTDTGREQRYFKGANKIFQLSDYHPVGMMIYDSADILDVPWEIVIKEFRRSLGNKSFNTLNGYAHELFTFMDSDQRLFPETLRRSKFISAARWAALGLVMKYHKPSEPEGDRLALIEAAISARLGELGQVKLPEQFSTVEAADVALTHRDDVVKVLTEWKQGLRLLLPTDLTSLADLGLWEVLKHPGEHVETSGLVFAGFGDHDIFPAVIAYQSYGMFLGKHAAKETERVAITHDQPAWMTAFAQTEMSDTFSLGMSREVSTLVAHALAEHLPLFAEEIIKASGGEASQVPDLGSLVDSRRQAITTAFMDKAQNDHQVPLRRVLSVLPVDEMASFAETMIGLQSLKEKVTKPSETVSGPIDVVMITKNEGLVWIKRKHFYDHHLLNSRLFATAGRHGMRPDDGR